jgi:hypothetical protein
VPSQSKRTPSIFPFGDERMFGVVRLAESEHVTRLNDYMRATNCRQSGDWRSRACSSRLEEAGGDPIVAVELHVVEGGGDSVPTRSGCGVAALHVSARREHDVAVPHGLADENDLELEDRTGRERPRTKEANPGGADVAGHKSDGKLFGDVVNAAQAQRQLEGGTWVDAMLRVHADGVSGYACETPGLPLRGERGQT